MLSIAQSCGWYEFIYFMSSGLWMTWTTPNCEFRVMDDMNDLGSHEPKLLDVINNSGLRRIWTILSCEPMDLNALNSSRLCITWKILSREPRALYVMKISGLWLTGMSLGHELRAIDAINNSRLLMTWATLGHEQLQVMTLDAMSNLGLWMISTTSDPVTSVL